MNVTYSFYFEIEDHIMQYIRIKLERKELQLQSSLALEFQILVGHRGKEEKIIA